MRNLQGKIVLITGASRGIGAATARAFAREGARVVLSARNREALEAVAQAIREETGRETLVLPADVSREEDLRDLVRDTLQAWGRLDVVVANAGVYVQAPVRETTREHFQRAFAVNFYGGALLVLEALPHLLSQGEGHIVLVTSMDAKKGIPPDGPYVAAKAALSLWGDVLRQELRGTGVGVSIVFPGRVDTDMVAHLRVPWISAKMPPEKVARAIVRAVKKRRAEVIVPWQARLFWWAQVFSPSLADAIVRWFRLSGWPAIGTERDTHSEEGAS